MYNSTSIGFNIFHWCIFLENRKIKEILCINDPNFVSRENLKYIYFGCRILFHVVVNIYIRAWIPYENILLTPIVKFLTRNWRWKCNYKVMNFETWSFFISRYTV